MSLRVVGAGLGRTGTHSLKLALERLLGAPCYHMVEVFKHPEHAHDWHQAAIGQMPDWEALFSGYTSAVDWPASAFWPELSEAYPDALVILSTRSAQSWMRSARATIFSSINSHDSDTPWRQMVDAMMASRFTSALDDDAACIAAFERHNAHVREAVPPNRLLEWTATDGWEPICKSLGLPVPDEPFPLTNTTEQFLAHMGARPAADQPPS